MECSIKMIKRAQTIYVCIYVFICVYFKVENKRKYQKNLHQWFGPYKIYPTKYNLQWKSLVRSILFWKIPLLF
ncbi:hypothetical protein CHH55_15735 [Niallia circulans]|nr:hypothetical protein CHH55_15735 [Niallia circulans]